jgi:hypothetical protein
MLARALGAAVEGSPETQARIIEALRRSDEKSKVESSQSPAAVVLEALLVACHEKRPEIHVFEIAELANGIFLGRHDDQVLSPKALGGILRAELALASSCARNHRRKQSSSSTMRMRSFRPANVSRFIRVCTPQSDENEDEYGSSDEHQELVQITRAPACDYPVQHNDHRTAENGDRKGSTHAEARLHPPIGDLVRKNKGISTGSRNTKTGKATAATTGIAKDSWAIFSVLIQKTERDCGFSIALNLRYGVPATND